MRYIIRAKSNYGVIRVGDLIVLDTDVMSSDIVVVWPSLRIAPANEANPAFILGAVVSVYIKDSPMQHDHILTTDSQEKQRCIAQ